MIEPDDKKVGPGQPPVEHQFKKGRSGNPQGRPRRVERTYMPRQVRRDILSVTEAEHKVQTAKGPKTLTTIEIALTKLAQKATAGDRASIRLLVDLHRSAIEGHTDAHQTQFELLEHYEKRVSLDDKEMKTSASQKHVNSYRRGTRKP